MNKRDATRRAKGPVRRVADPGAVNAFTQFVRDGLERVFSGNQSAMAEASGLSRETINKYVNDARPALAVMPNERTLQRLARALDVPLERVQEVARKAESPHDPDLPPSQADLRKAYTDDLRAEIARRDEILAAENERRERQLAKICEVAGDWEFDLREAEQAVIDHVLRWAEGRIGESWDEPLTKKGLADPELVRRWRVIQSVYGSWIGSDWPPPPPKRAYVEERVLHTCGRAERLSRRIEEVETRCRAVAVPAERIEDDPFPEAEYHEALEEIRLAGEEMIAVYRAHAETLIKAHPLEGETPEVGWDFTGETGVMYLFPHGRHPANVVEGDVEEPGWAARDYPEWAQKPDEDEDFDGGV